jgi:hypothetical protein
MTPAPLLCGTPLSSRGVAREHLRHLFVQSKLLEESALLAPDLVRDRGRLAAIFERKDVGRMTLLQQVHCGGR